MDKTPSLTPYFYCSDDPLIRVDLFGLDDYYYTEGSTFDKPDIVHNENPDRYFIQNSEGNISYKNNDFYQVNSKESLEIYFEQKG